MKTVPEIIDDVSEAIVAGLTPIAATGTLAFEYTTDMELDSEKVDASATLHPAFAVPLSDDYGFTPIASTTSDHYGFAQTWHCWHRQAMFLTRGRIQTSLIMTTTMDSSVGADLFDIRTFVSVSAMSTEKINSRCKRKSMAGRVETEVVSTKTRAGA